MQLYVVSKIDGKIVDGVEMSALWGLAPVMPIESEVHYAPST